MNFTQPSWPKILRVQVISESKWLQINLYVFRCFQSLRLYGHAWITVFQVQKSVEHSFSLENI